MLELDPRGSEVEVHGCNNLAGNDPNGSTRSSTATHSCLDGGTYEKGKKRSKAVRRRRMMTMTRIRTKTSAMLPAMISSYEDEVGKLPEVFIYV